jgi:hypothetical protein
LVEINNVPKEYCRPTIDTLILDAPARESFPRMTARIECRTSGGPLDAPRVSVLGRMMRASSEHLLVVAHRLEAYATLGKPACPLKQIVQVVEPSSESTINMPENWPNAPAAVPHILFQTRHSTKRPHLTLLLNQHLVY